MINKEQVIKITSIIAILGLINVPIVKFSVDWWSTLHQTSSVNILSETSIHSINVNTISNNDCGIYTIFNINFFNEI